MPCLTGTPVILELLVDSPGTTTPETSDGGRASLRRPLARGSASPAAHLAERHEIVLDVGAANALWLVAVVGDDHGDRWVEAADAGDECP